MCQKQLFQEQNDTISFSLSGVTKTYQLQFLHIYHGKLVCCYVAVFVLFELGTKHNHYWYVYTKPYLLYKESTISDEQARTWEVISSFPIKGSISILGE